MSLKRKQWTRSHPAKFLNRTMPVSFSPKYGDHRNFRPHMFHRQASLFVSFMEEFDNKAFEKMLVALDGARTISAYCFDRLTASRPSKHVNSLTTCRFGHPNNLNKHKSYNLRNLPQRLFIDNQALNEAMIDEGNSLCPAEIPAGHALDAVIDAVYFGRLPFMLCCNNDRIDFILARLRADYYAFIATDAAVFIMKYLKVSFHRLHSFSRTPVLSNNSTVQGLCPCA